MQTIYRKIPVSEHPPKWGWYDTDKGNLFWYEQKKEWSSREDFVSEEYPKFWYQAIDLPSEEEIENEFPLSYFSGAVQIDLPQNKLARKGAKYIIDMITKTK